MAVTVETKRGSSASITPRSGSSSTLASRSSEPNAAVKACRLSFQAPRRSAWRTGSATAFQWAARSGRAEPGGDRGEPVAAGPAHRGRMGVDALPPAIFPDAGVGLQREFAGLAAERFQQPKQSFVAEPRQAPVEEHRHRGEDDAAVGVVLHLHGGGVADAHRPVAAIALELLAPLSRPSARSERRCRPAATARWDWTRCSR